MRSDRRPTMTLISRLPIILLCGLTIIGWSGCVRSDNEQLLGDENVIRQRRNNTCGPAALAMVLADHDVNVTEGELERQLPMHDDGASLRSLIVAAERYGVRLEAWRLRFDAIDSVHLPAILWIDDDHFVVLDSVRTDGVFVRDPAKGRLRWTREGLRSRWNGTAAVAVRTP